MLIDFKVTNFRSIRETQTLSLVASASDELSENLCSTSFSPKLKLLRSAAIYGPNAAGKSNLIRALEFLKKWVLSSARESQEGEKIPIQPFSFDSESSKLPSEFEIAIFKNNCRYEYGVVLNRDRILEEWLFAYPLGKPQKWFHRKYHHKEYHWKFSDRLEGTDATKEMLKNATRQNALFLSTAVQLNNDQLKTFFHWFQEDLLVIFPSKYLSLQKTLEMLESENNKETLLKYMNVVDPSVSNFELKDDEMEDIFEKYAKKFISSSRNEIVHGVYPKYKKLSLVHADNFPLLLQDESDGTQKSLELFGYLDNVLKKGKVLIVDELDSSLHALIAKFIINLFYHSKNNKKDAQLIFSTHNTMLLDKLFRRDQVWFVKKDQLNATQLYSLAEFSARQGEAFGKNYLQGRYGALPYIGEWGFDE